MHPAMTHPHCQTCSFWDQAHGLERTSLGAIAPCTRHAPRHFHLETIALTGSPPDLQAFLNHDNCIDDLQIPMAIWPYTSRNQMCGDYKPCDLEEGVRRHRMQSAPLL